MRIKVSNDHVVNDMRDITTERIVYFEGAAFLIEFAFPHLLSQVFVLAK